ncbi:MAG: LamG domain-containing protein, partial [Candidatus Omnitrophica bacterium]|nr:LamG domain-containing protein [Candidatus Omnitrophota bacterium]
MSEIEASEAEVIQMRMSTNIRTFTALAICLAWIMPQSLWASGSLRFDGIDDYVEIPPQSSLEITKEITFEAWIKWEEELGISEFQIILNRDFIAYEFSIGEGKGNGNFLWALGDVSTSAPDAYGGWRIAGPIPRNDWVHVAMTYDGDRARAYINGEKVADHNAGGKIRNQANSPVRIGMRMLNAHSSYFHGCIDEVRLWALTRDDDQIKSDMNYRLAGKETGLVVYWELEEGQGQKLNDLTANKNEGVFGNSE